MTQTGSLSKEITVTGRFIGYRIKRSWAVMLLSFIVMFFSLVVPFLMSADMFRGYLNEGLDDMFKNRIFNYFYDNALWGLFMSGGLAVAIGCSSLSYLHNKISAGFFHSTPEKRSGHYIAALCASVADFVLPLAVNMLILALAVAVNGFFYNYVAVLMIKLAAMCLLAYFSVLASCFVAGMLTGTGMMHVLITAYLLFILPVIYYCCNFWIFENTEYLRYDVWGDLGGLQGILLSPVIRIIWVAMYTFGEADITLFSISSLVIELILIPLMLFGAYHLYKKRPIECTGTPVIYRPVAGVVKYTAMFIGTFLFAILFYQLGDSGWAIFGFAAGIILSFMLANTVLNRNSKAMFKGLNTLGIFVGVVIVLFIVLNTVYPDMLDHRVPAASEITVKIDGNEYVFTDDEMIAEFRDEMKEFNELLKDDTTNVVNNYNVEIARGESSFVGPTEDVYYDVDYYSKDIQQTLYSSARSSNLYVTYKGVLGETRYRYYNVHTSALADIAALCLKNADLFEGAAIPDISDGNFDASVNMYFFLDRASLLNAIEANPKLLNEYPHIVKILSEKANDSLCRINIDCQPIIDGYYDRVTGEYVEFDGEHSADAIKAMQDVLDSIDTVMQSKDERQSVGYIAASVYSQSMYKDSVDYSRTVSAPIYADGTDIIVSVLENASIYVSRITVEYYVGGVDGYYESLEFSGGEAAIIACLNEKTDYVSSVAENVAALYVLDFSTGELVKHTDSVKIKEYLDRAALLYGNAMLAPFTPTDGRYAVYVEMQSEYHSFVTYLFEK